VVTLEELSQKEDLFVAGHTLCRGCTIPSILKIILRSTNYPIIIANASGCLQTGSTQFPATSWKTNWIHSSQTDAAAVISGIETVYTSLKKKGKIPENREIKFMVIGGDGATYDSGMATLSGALERGHNFVYLCYDNQSYAYSGGQRSSASPMGASTSTTPAAKILPGKLQFRKDIAKIVASHRISYFAQSAPWFWEDLYQKAKTAFDSKGPSFINVISPCPPHWGIASDQSVELTKLAVDACIWPLFEIKNDWKITINYKPKDKLPVMEWLKIQGRFSHLFKSENKWILEKIQEDVDSEWEFLQSLEYKSKGN